MAVTYVDQKASNGVQVRQDLHDDTIHAEFDIAEAIATAANGGGGAGATAFVINDIIQMVKVAAGMKILDVLLSVDALDSSTGIVLEVGDGDDTDRYITGTTIGRSSASGVARLNNHAGHLFEYSAADTIDVKIATAASGTAVTSGKIRLSVRVTPQQ